MSRLRTSEERVKLLKAGVYYKDIEKLYLDSNSFKIITGYMFNMSKDLIVWTKKLGQRHYALAGFNHETLCGRPMLGNNYADVIPVNEQEECDECLIVLRNMNQQATNDMLHEVVGNE